MTRKDREKLLKEIMNEKEYSITIHPQTMLFITSIDPEEFDIKDFVSWWELEKIGITDTHLLEYIKKMDKSGK